MSFLVLWLGFSHIPKRGVFCMCYAFLCFVIAGSLKSILLFLSDN